MNTGVLALDAVVAAALFAGKRARVAFALAAAALVLVLIGQSPPRLVGDSGEYIAMAINLGQFARPSLTQQDLADATTYVPGDAGAHLAMPEFRAADGRQDFPHFWFYSLLAAPFVRAAIALGKNPITGFTVLNVLLLSAAAFVLVRRYSASAASFLVLGPVMWWVDKAHTEVFTVALLAIAVAFLETAPWWSLVALGAASTQNPPIAGAMIIAMIYALRGWGTDRRVIVGALVGIAFAALHPLYFHERLGVWTGLFLGIDRHWPSSTELLAPMTDLNLGILVHDPFIMLAAAGAFIVALTHDPRRIVRGPHMVVALAALLFLASFTQAGNFNSGGTPGPSRYGLWLLPLAIPVIAPTATAWWMRTIAVASVVWCSSHFALKVPEQYLRPTEIADRVWHRQPQIDNPLAEVFAERVSGREPPQKPPIATSGCEKLLVVGNGINVEWPPQCAALVPKAPTECRQFGALCYANRTLTSYVFTHAVATPSWLLWEQQPETLEVSQAAGAPPSLTLPPAEQPRPTLWLGAGWSYVEHDMGAPQTSTWRWMGERARLDVVVPAPVRLRVRLVLAAFSKARRLRISLNGTAIATISVTQGQHGYETPPVDLAAGNNSFLFEDLDGTDSPGGKDARRLSIALYHADVAP